MAYRFVNPRQDFGDGISPADGAKLFFFDIGTSNPKTTYSDFALTIPNADPVVADAEGVFGDIFLDIEADVTLKDKNNVVIWGPESIYAPDDSVNTIPASSITVLDTAGHFLQTDVELVLKEIADGFANKSGTATITASWTWVATMNLADQIINRPVLQDYAVKHASVSSSAGNADYSLASANSFDTTLTENTTVLINNPPATGNYGQLVIEITQDGAGGAYTVTWPASVIWPGGTAPVMSTGNDAVDVFTLHTRNAGTTWYGDFSQAYA